MDSEHPHLHELIIETIITMQKDRKMHHIAPEVAIHRDLVTEVLRLSIIGFDFPEKAMDRLKAKILKEIQSAIDILVAEKKVIKQNAINDFTYSIKNYE